MADEKYLALRGLRTQQALEGGELDNAYWAPGTENQAAGLTKVRSDMAPLLRLFESGHFNPGSSRPDFFCGRTGNRGGTLGWREGLCNIRNLFRAFDSHISVGWVHSTCPLFYLSWLLWYSVELFCFSVSFPLLSFLFYLDSRRGAKFGTEPRVGPSGGGSFRVVGPHRRNGRKFWALLQNVGNRPDAAT